MSEWKKVEQPLTPEEPASEPDTAPEERAPETLPAADELAETVLSEPAAEDTCVSSAAVYRGRSAPRPE